MNIIMLLWWSLGRGNPVVPSRWQATTRSSRHLEETPSLLKVSATDPEERLTPTGAAEREGVSMESRRGKYGEYQCRGV